MPGSIVFEICNAYEAGVGHCLKKDESDAPYIEFDLKEAWITGYNAGTEIADENASKEYQKHEFCKDSGCPNFDGVKCDHASKNPLLCNRTAREFH